MKDSTFVFLTYDFNKLLTESAEGYLNSYLLQRKLAEDALGLLQEASSRRLDISNALRQISYEGVSGKIEFDDTLHVKRDSILIQLNMGRFVVQSRIRKGEILENKWLQSGQKLPTSDLPERVNTVYPLWLNIIEVIVCTVALTVVLILFIYYHKEPEIKATSWLLSLLMILSCYVVVTNLFTNILHFSLPPLSPHFNTCSFLFWISGYGIPQPLIMAVLLVKMLYVYHIFHNSRKLSKYSSDYAMAVYIVLILSPNILVLIITTALDTYHVSAIHTFHTDHIEVKYVCMGDLNAYFQTLLVYLILLIVCTAIVAYDEKVKTEAFP